MKGTGCISLASCKEGQTGKVIAVLGDKHVRERLEVLGIRKGTVLMKKVQQMGQGPIIAAVGNLEIAVGFDLARNVIIRVEV
ncbi:MAG TPA: ferrous iron transport protein A [Clostridiaceae bacterium]|jgi:Fe2+ transport system protein FeoA|nr:ferrous iron transport protein A [Clostridiaceae bacterium]